MAEQSSKPWEAEGASGEIPLGESVSAEQMAAGALRRATRAAQRLSDHAPAVDASPSLELPEFSTGSGAAVSSIGLDLLDDVTLPVRIELGRVRMLIQDVLRLNANSVVELDKDAGGPVDICVNGRCIARGEVIVHENKYCVRVTEIVQENDTPYL